MSRGLRGGYIFHGKADKVLLRNDAEKMCGVFYKLASSSSSLSKRKHLNGLLTVQVLLFIVQLYFSLYSNQSTIQESHDLTAGADGRGGEGGVGSAVGNAFGNCPRYSLCVRITSSHVSKLIRNFRLGASCLLLEIFHGHGAGASLTALENSSGNHALLMCPHGCLGVILAASHVGKRIAAGRLRRTSGTPHEG